MDEKPCAHCGHETLTGEQQVLLQAIDNLRLELERVNAKCDALAAENRVLRIGLEEGAFDELGNCTLCGDTGQQAERHATHCPVGAAMLAHPTARESSLSCGHPSGCWIIDGKTASVYCGCGWCAAVAKCDALAAENRVMREALRLADVHIGYGDISLENVHDTVRRAIAQPHTAREVERVKRLERFAAEWSRQRKQMQGEGVTGREYRTLYILWKLAMGKELTTNEADDYAALDKLSKDGQ